MPNLTTLLLVDAIDKAWSEEAREAAAEARRAGAKGKEPAGGGRKPAGDGAKMPKLSIRDQAEAQTQAARDVFDQHMKAGTVGTQAGQAAIRDAHTHAADWHGEAAMSADNYASRQYSKSREGYHRDMARQAEQAQIRMGGKPHLPGFGPAMRRY